MNLSFESSLVRSILRDIHRVDRVEATSTSYLLIDLEYNQWIIEVS